MMQTKEDNKIQLPIEFKTLEPFPYSKWKGVLITFGLIFLLIGLTIILTISISHMVNNDLIGGIFVFIVFGSGILILLKYENRVLYKTKYSGSLIIEHDKFIINGEDLYFNRLGSLQLSIYLKPDKSTIDKWKYCYELVITKALRNKQTILVTLYSVETKESLPQVFNALKHSNMELYKKIEIY